MKRTSVLSIVLLIALGAVAGEKTSSEIKLLAPADGAEVSILQPGHRAWMAMPREERVKKFADMKGYRREMTATGTLPARVKLSWACDHDGKPCKGVYAVEVTKRRDGKVFFAAENLKTNEVELVNLESGEEYTWCVWCGKKANGARFRTENAAPRWLDWRGVALNARDFGGWRTKDGFRVRQGYAFRSRGLNDNALTFLNKEETLALHAAGQLEAQFGKKGREIAELIDSGKFEPDDSRLRKTFKRDKFEKGKLHGTPEAREWVRTFFGIATDIDLRRPETECWGMTGSPLGEKVAWLNIPSSCYSGMGSDKAKKAFKQSFDVFLDPTKFGIVFHCIGGADRTGSLAFILNSLLGVEEDDLWKDWELTAFVGQGSYFQHNRIEWLYKVFNAFPGETIHERIENYVKATGVTDAEIAKLRELWIDRGGKPVDFRGLPKWHEPKGISNMRDFGGWTGLGGKKVRTGRVYRSATLNGVKPEGVKYMTETLGIVTDLDLRTPEVVKKCGSKTPLGEKVTLENRSAPAYGGFASKGGKAYFAATFRWLINEAKYPLVFHCSKGADRTGSIAFLLNGLLGVPEADLRYDWELTQNFNGNPLFKHRTRYNRLVEMIEAHGGATFTDKVVAYAHACGLTDDEIARWRGLMLE